ncbi:MAG: hypothetical protein ACK5JU_07960 [Bacteroidales bacterium]
MQVTSKQGQWLGDIAIREAGSIDALVELAINNDLSITGKITPGDTLSKPTQVDKRVTNYYALNNLYPATSTEIDMRNMGGIGYMAIGITFKVS